MNWFYQTRKGIILSHIIAWICVLAFPFVMRDLVMPGAKDPPGFPEPSTVLEWGIVFGFQLLMVGFFYLNSWALVPKLLWKHKIWPYFGAILAILLGIILLFMVVQGLDWLQEATFIKNRRPFGMTVLYLIFWFASLGHCMTLAWFRSEKARRDLENEKLKTELSFLQGQVNPHFLFNTLNTIYTLSHQKSERTPGAVMQLSNLLRYVLDTPADEVLLTEEIRHLEDLIALHRLRLTSKTTVIFDMNGSPEGIRIAPMLFLPFVENAFKYGVSAHRESDIRFEMDIKSSELVFTAVNVNFKISDQDTRTSGIGIPNVRRRLELLYPQRHHLDIKDTPDLYTVKLSVNL